LILRNRSQGEKAVFHTRRAFGCDQKAMLGKIWGKSAWHIVDIGSKSRVFTPDRLRKIKLAPLISTRQFREGRTCLDGLGNDSR
jgi:hypothetical protein